jgi:cell division protein FtsZ
MGDEVRVTVIAAGFERWEDGARPAERPSIFSSPGSGETVDIFADGSDGDDEFGLGDDDFDVPSFLR